MQLEFEIVLQDDNEMIFQNAGTSGRIVVRKFDLWVPQLGSHLKDKRWPMKTS